MDDERTLRAKAETILTQLVGKPNAHLRADQWEAIRALVVDRRRALVVQRTGWGKSAVYFVATALLRAAGAGPTVIVSPLLSLMRNQVDAARRAGISAETINSANLTEWDQVHARIAAGQVDVLLISPERLNNPGFRDEVLPHLAHDAGLLVVDEAHCVSDWGHDFRPEYRRVGAVLAGLPPTTPVLATTATANARVSRDVAEQLAGDGHDVLVLRGTLERDSLTLGVRELPDQAAQLAWLVANLPHLPGSGIIYTLTVSAAEQVAEHLRHAGIRVRAYSGQTDAAERLACEADLLANNVKALVATSALGMGFDKPDLGFVVHVGAPASPIAYYQQVGRAGRATEHAKVVLLPSAGDQAIWDWFASMAFPGQRHVATALDVLADASGPMSTAALETRVDLRRNRLELMLKVLDVDGAVRRVRGGWESTGRPWTYDADRYARVEAARSAEQDAMREYVCTPRCRMAFLRAALDDPELVANPEWTCGRCDRCTGTLGDVPVDEAQVADARHALAVPGVDVPARRMWPTAMSTLGVPVAGKIGPDQLAEDGRALARADSLGLGALLRELATDSDGPLPAPLRGPVAQALAAWTPQVDVVVSVPSSSRPQLVRHLAEGVANLLGVPHVGSLAALGPDRVGHQVNSAQRLAGVWSRLSAPTALGRAVAGQRVLLVDDRTDSGWTLTVAAALLRPAGAVSVTPFVLGIG